GQVLAVGAVHHGGYLIPMAVQGAELGELLAIPGEDLHAPAVPVGAGEALPVGAEVQFRKPPRLPVKDLDWLTSTGIPYVNPFPSGHEKTLPVTTEDRGAGNPGIGHHVGVQLLASLQVPYAYGTSHLFVGGRCRQQPAVAAEGHTDDPTA